jgi:hypothetical protein
MGHLEKFFHQERRLILGRAARHAIASNAYGEENTNILGIQGFSGFVLSFFVLRNLPPNDDGAR